MTAASLAAFHADIRIGHVEAGLRTYRKRQPFPEEINRRIVSLVADLHFAPSEQARQNLLREGISDDCIVVVGNPVIDALHWVMSLPFAATKLPVTCRELQQPDTKIILVTAHRRENMGQPLENICLSLRDIASRYENHVRIVFPVHLNPNVRKTVHRLLEGVPSITTTQPLDYQSLVHLMSRSYLVLTDSGGIQEEASAIGKPVLVLREVTERTEVVEAGIARMVGTDRGQITAETVRLLENADAYRQMARATTLYGDGHAAKRIVLALLGENG